MTQFDFGTIDRNESGSDLATQIEGFRNAVQSLNKGPSAPAYAVAGTPWLDDSAASWTMKVYDGTDWIPWFTINPSTNAIQIATAALILASQAEAEAGLISDKLMTPLTTAQAIAVLAVPATRVVSAGDGLVGGGALGANITIDMGNPTTLTGATTNAVTASSHTHNVSLTAADVVPSSSSAIGAYGFFAHTSSSTLANNATVAGSALDWSPASGTGGGGTPAGTWRVMGRFTGSIGSPTQTSLCVRIS